MKLATRPQRTRRIKLAKGKLTGESYIINKPTNAQQDRGRDAEAPPAIPSVGWKDILWRVYREVSNDRVLLIAAGVTFYLLLALVPGLTALVSIYGLFADPDMVREHVGMVSSAVPSGGATILNDQLQRLTEQGSGALGWALCVSVLIALWSTNSGMKALFDAMNVAYNENEQRGFVKLTAVTLAFTLITITVVLLLIAMLVLLTAVIDNFGLGKPVIWGLRLFGYLVLLAMLSTAIASIYRWGPSRDSAQWKWITPGCTVSAVVMIAAAVGFSWYVANFGSYNATYGSLGALIGFMTWIWLSVIILIMGAELNAEIEHQTRRDTTIGIEQPMGKRGAEMADTLGESA